MDDAEGGQVTDIDHQSISKDVWSILVEEMTVTLPVPSLLALVVDVR